ncbi:MAG TPA: adenylyltransferase/cytidyltransferase family protein [Candidatus Nanopelagicales bacterium]|jgi:glycerol-3-phosphate cytidylyltransferase|nr:adenylyltransferase/cytidyltransferase family protein [Candidatus Nanopelagicales bacterium]
MKGAAGPAAGGAASVTGTIGSWAGQPDRDLAAGVVGYTAGVFDLFNVGHLNLLRQAREQCDHLIVGVSTDELVLRTRGAAPVYPFLERLAIVQNIRYVDQVVPQGRNDKLQAWQLLRFDVLFAGDNRRADPVWQQLAAGLGEAGVQVRLLPATRTGSGMLLDHGEAYWRADHLD